MKKEISKYIYNPLHIPLEDTGKNEFLELMTCIENYYLKPIISLEARIGSDKSYHITLRFYENEKQYKYNLLPAIGCTSEDPPERLNSASNIGVYLHVSRTIFVVRKNRRDGLSLKFITSKFFNQLKGRYIFKPFESNMTKLIRPFPKDWLELQLELLQK